MGQGGGQGGSGLGRELGSDVTIVGASGRSRVILVLGIVLAVTVGAAGWWWYEHRLGFPIEHARNSLPAGLTGCWSLSDGEGEGAQDRFYAAPSFAQLHKEANTSVSYGGSGTVRRVFRFDSLGRAMDEDTVRQSGPSPQEFTYWAVDSLADRLRIHFSTGFSGTQFVFTLPDDASVSDTLWGHAYSHWDHVPYPTDEGSAYAARVPCANVGEF